MFEFSPLIVDQFGQCFSVVFLWQVLMFLLVQFFLTTYLGGPSMHTLHTMYIVRVRTLPSVS